MVTCRAKKGVFVYGEMELMGVPIYATLRRTDQTEIGV